MDISKLVEQILPWAILIILTGYVLYMALKHGLAGAIIALTAVRGDVPNLTRVEGAVIQAFPQSQLDVVRNIVLPMFALGLAITPQGDIKQTIDLIRDVFNVTTDGKPNEAPGSGASG